MANGMRIIESFDDEIDDSNEELGAYKKREKSAPVEYVFAVLLTS
jgi:hypothetical protein